jgi:hypothetical protein
MGITMCIKIPKKSKQTNQENETLLEKEKISLTIWSSSGVSV